MSAPSNKPGCASLGPSWVGDPVDVITGEMRDEATEFRLRGPVPFAWVRHLSTAWVLEQRQNGWGHRHAFDRCLRFDLDGVRYERPDGPTVEFHVLSQVGARDARQGHVLERVGEDLYQVRKVGEPIYELRRAFGRKRREAKLVRMVDGLHEAHFDYDGQERLVGVVDYAHRTLRVEYTREGLLRAIVWLRPEGQVTCVEYEYDRHGFLLGGRDAYGKAFRYDYDDAGRVVRKVNRRGVAFEYVYDDAGRCVRARGEHGEVGITLAYRPEARETTVTHESTDAQWMYRYEPEGTLREIEAPDGGIHTFVLADDGHVVAEVDASGQVWPYARDGAGRAYGKRDGYGYLRPLDAEPHRVAPALAHRMAETALGWEHGGLEAPGFEVPWATSLPPQLPLEARQALVGAEHTGVEREVRDDFDTLVRVEKSMSGQEVRRTYRYDGTGNTERFTDFDGGTWQYVYREWTQHVEEVDPLGGVTQLEHTPWDRLTRVVDPGGTESAYTYDAQHRLAEVHRHGRMRERYVYDPIGRLIEKQGPEGSALVRYKRGPGSVLMKREGHDGTCEVFERDAHGRKTSATNAQAACTFAHTYGGLRTADLRADEGVRTRFLGREALEVETLGVRVRYLRPQADTLLVVDPTDRVHRVQRLGAGIVRRELASGTTEVSQHDGRGRCWGKTSYWDSGSKRPWTRKFWRSGEGDLLAREDSLRGTSRYTYDAAHRLTSVTDADGRQGEYAHDAAGNLRKKPGLADAHVGGRDDGLVQVDRGNRLYRANGDRFDYDTRDHVRARHGAWGKLGYEHDALDRLRRITFAAAEAGETYPPGHPAYGLELHRYGAPETVWEADYDPLGRRTETRVYGAPDATGERACARSRFWWDRDRLAAEEGPDGALRVYVYADVEALVPFMWVDYASREEASERPQDGERYYVFTDHRGCPERVEDDGGEVVWEATIHPYGECEVHVGADFHQPLRFPGHYHDAATGLHYNRFRYYSPELGRYLESDPVGVAGGLNLYGYCCDSNPLRDVDLRGLTQNCPRRRGEDGASEEGADAEQATNADGDATQPSPEPTPARPRRPTERERHADTRDRQGRAFDDLSTQEQSDRRAAHRAYTDGLPTINGRRARSPSVFDMNWDPTTRRYHLPEDTSAGRQARERGRDHVQYDDQGNPNLAPFNHPDLGGEPVPFSGFSSDRDANMRGFRDGAREDLGDGWPPHPRNASGTAPQGWTWHETRNGDGYLVPTDLHDAVPHTGGVSAAQEI
ncbi:MAG: HNH endonuclease [Sandaracinaceae bacterium]|nr:HNH endonuclease [Sandaracinaceae bacterium]